MSKSNNPLLYPGDQCWPTATAGTPQTGKMSESTAQMLFDRLQLIDDDIAASERSIADANRTVVSAAQFLQSAYETRKKLSDELDRLAPGDFVPRFPPPTQIPAPWTDAPRPWHRAMPSILHPGSGHVAKGNTAPYHYND